MTKMARNIRIGGRPLSELTTVVDSVPVKPLGIDHTTTNCLTVSVETPGLAEGLAGDGAALELLDLGGQPIIDRNLLTIDLDSTTLPMSILATSSDLVTDADLFSKGEPLAFMLQGMLNGLAEPVRAAVKALEDGFMQLTGRSSESDPETLRADNDDITSGPRLEMGPVIRGGYVEVPIDWNKVVQDTPGITRDAPEILGIGHLMVFDGALRDQRRGLTAALVASINVKFANEHVAAEMRNIVTQHIPEEMSIRYVGRQVQDAERGYYEMRMHLWPRGPEKAERAADADWQAFVELFPQILKSSGQQLGEQDVASITGYIKANTDFRITEGQADLINDRFCDMATSFELWQLVNPRIGELAKAVEEDAPPPDLTPQQQMAIDYVEMRGATNPVRELDHNPTQRMLVSDPIWNRIHGPMTLNLHIGNLWKDRPYRREISLVRNFGLGVALMIAGVGKMRGAWWPLRSGKGYFLVDSDGYHNAFDKLGGVFVIPDYLIMQLNAKLEMNVVRSLFESPRHGFTVEPHGKDGENVTIKEGGDTLLIIGRSHIVVPYKEFEHAFDLERAITLASVFLEVLHEDPFNLVLNLEKVALHELTSFIHLLTEAPTGTHAGEVVSKILQELRTSSPAASDLLRETQRSIHGELTDESGAIKERQYVLNIDDGELAAHRLKYLLYVTGVGTRGEKTLSFSFQPLVDITRVEELIKEVHPGWNIERRGVSYERVEGGLPRYSRQIVVTDRAGEEVLGVGNASMKINLANAAHISAAVRLVDEVINRGFFIVNEMDIKDPENGALLPIERVLLEDWQMVDTLFHYLIETQIEMEAKARGETGLLPREGTLAHVGKILLGAGYASPEEKLKHLITEIARRTFSELNRIAAKPGLGTEIYVEARNWLLRRMSELDIDPANL